MNHHMNKSYSSGVGEYTNKYCKTKKKKVPKNIPLLPTLHRLPVRSPKEHQILHARRTSLFRHRRAKKKKGTLTVILPSTDHHRSPLFIWAGLLKKRKSCCSSQTSSGFTIWSLQPSWGEEAVESVKRCTKRENEPNNESKLNINPSET